MRDPFKGHLKYKWILKRPSKVEKVREPERHGEWDELVGVTLGVPGVLECPRLPDFSGQEDSPDCPKFRVSRGIPWDSVALTFLSPGVVLTASVRGLSIVSRGAGGVTELPGLDRVSQLIVKASSEQRPPRWFMSQVPQMCIHLLLSDRETQFNQLKELISGGPLVPCPHPYFSSAPCPACPCLPTHPEILGLPGLWAAVSARVGSNSSWTLKPNPCRQITDSHHPDTQFRQALTVQPRSTQNPSQLWLWPASGPLLSRGLPWLWGCRTVLGQRGSVLEQEKQPL